MSSEWKTLEISSICEGIFDGPHATPKKTNEGPVFLGISALDKGRLNLTEREHLSEEDFLKWTKRVTPQAGDIVFSYETRLGEVAMIPSGLRCCLGRRMALMRIDQKKALPEYVLYAYMSPAFQEVIRARTIHGSTVDRIPLTEFGSFPISVPGLFTQKAITSILRSLDDCITLLRDTNATLEGIAQAIFKSWFVDFDPVRAKMEGRAPEGMDEETAALFPEGFEESKLGLVPKGWLPARLDSFIELAYGKALKADSRIPGNVPVYGSGGLTGWHNSPLVNEPSIVIGRKGTVGSLYWESRPFFPIDTVFYVKSKKPLTYIYQVLKLLSLHDMNTDAAVPGLNRENVYRLLIPAVPDCVVVAFNKIASTLRQKIDSNSAQVKTLEHIRDTLLPRLISGQLRLPEAEQAAAQL